MNVLEMEEWRKFQKKKYTVVQPNDKLVVGARVIYNCMYIYIGQHGDVEEYRCRLTA